MILSMPQPLNTSLPLASLFNGPLTGTLFVLKVCPLGSGAGPIDVHVVALVSEFKLVGPKPSVLAVLTDFPSCRFISRIALPRALGSKRVPRSTPRRLLTHSARLCR